jgi:hypothetical protein
VPVPLEGPRGSQTTGTEEEGVGVGDGNPGGYPTVGLGSGTIVTAEFPATSPDGSWQELRIIEDPTIAK